jgi:hypothetical protein
MRWIINNQLGRWNLDELQKANLIGRRYGVSADLLNGFEHIIVQSHRRDSVGTRGTLVEDAVTIDREASATPTA